MLSATLTRQHTSPQGTFGVIECRRPNSVNGYPDEVLVLHSGELPWRNNKPHVSCIPTGRYTCHYRESSKRIGGISTWYEVMNVSGRGGILIHPGNYCGDESKGYRSDVEGCILLGTAFNPDNQQSVRNSRTACARLLDFFNGQDFLLEIVK